MNLLLDTGVVLFQPFVVQVQFLTVLLRQFRLVLHLLQFVLQDGDLAVGLQAAGFALLRLLGHLGLLACLLGDSFDLLGVKLFHLAVIELQLFVLGEHGLVGVFQQTDLALLARVVGGGGQETPVLLAQ